MRSVSIAHCVASLFFLLTSPACDLVVGSGQTTEVGNRGTVFGSGGDGFTAALPAVRVLQGRLVVNDADLLGGGNIVQNPSAPNLVPGRGVTVQGGVVVVHAGLVQGGALLSNVPGLAQGGGAGILADASTVDIEGGSVRGGSLFLSIPPGSAVPTGGGAPGLSARSSNVLIQGGSLVGGDVSSSVLPIPLSPGGALPILAPGSGLSAFDSDVTITGGTFRPGMPAEPVAVSLAALFAQSSRVWLRGGDFGDSSSIFLRDSNARLSGGQYRVLLFESTGTPSARLFVCSELTGGGPVRVIGAFGAAPVIIAGTNFNFPLGSGTITGPRLTGVLADGTPLDAQLAPQSNPEAISLIAPGTGGCG